MEMKKLRNRRKTVFLNYLGKRDVSIWIENFQNTCGPLTTLWSEEGVYQERDTQFANVWGFTAKLADL